MAPRFEGCLKVTKQEANLPDLPSAYRHKMTAGSLRIYQFDIMYFGLHFLFAVFKSFCLHLLYLFYEHFEINRIFLDFNII